MNKKLLLKSLISITLIILIFLKLDLAEFWKTFLSANLLIYFISFVSLIFQQWIIAYTWYIVLKAQNNIISLWQILRIHFIGNFFGTFLPTSIGMDVIRAYNLSKQLSKGVDAASSMFVVRVIGFLVLFVIALWICLFQRQHIQDQNVAYVISGAVIAFIIGLIALFVPPMRKLFYKILTLLKIRSVKDKLEYFYNSIIELSSDSKLMIKLIVLSLVMQIIGIFNFYLLGVALKIQVPLIYYFLYLPIIQIIVMIPISIAGIGVREGAFVYFFSQIGATKPEALSLSLLMFSQAIGIALIGGLLYWTGGLSHKITEKSKTIEVVN